MTTQRAEETRAIRKALAAAGIEARVEHGTGTAWGWLRINVGNANGHLDRRVTEIVRACGRTGHSLEQLNVLSQSRWVEKERKTVPILQADQRAGVLAGEVVEEIRGSDLRSGDVVLLDRDEVRLEVQTATSDGNWTHLQDPVGRRRSYSSLDRVRVVRAPLSRVYKFPPREDSAGLTAGILGTISETSGSTRAEADTDTTGATTMRIDQTNQTPSSNTPATPAPASKVPSVGGRGKKKDKPEEKKEAAADQKPEEKVEKTDPKPEAKPETDAKVDAKPADDQKPEARPPSSRGVAHRAAGGLTRSRTFLNRQADRVARWTNHPAALKVAEALREASGNLSEAITELNKFPADYVPPSTPNALGAEATVELKEKAFAEYAELFPADTSRVLTVQKVLAGGKLFCRTATGVLLTLNRAQVTPIVEKKSAPASEK